MGDDAPGFAGWLARKKCAIMALALRQATARSATVHTTTPTSFLLVILFRIIPNDAFLLPHSRTVLTNHARAVEKSLRHGERQAEGRRRGTV
jgi:hypothetical protein